MIARNAPAYHVLNMSARWAVDAHLNDEELKRCFRFEDTMPARDAREERLRDFHNNPHSLEFNRDIVVNDVRRALWASPHFGELYVHKNPFAFADLAFVRYRISGASGMIDKPFRYFHRVLA